MFRVDCAVAANLKMKLMTEAMTEAARIHTKVRDEIKAMGNDHHREKMANGERKAIRKAMMVPARKRANMMCEQILRMLMMVVSVEGRAIVAPDKSSSNIIWTMLNQ